MKLAKPGRLLSLICCRCAYLLKSERVPCTPPRIDLEPNNTCNLRCRHCQVTHWSKPAVHMDVAGFRRVLSQFPGLLSVKLQGMGEPLLNRDLVEMLIEGEKSGISMQLISNGTIIPPALLDAIGRMPRTHISFSLDGATAATFEEIRVGASFDKVVENISRVVKSRCHDRSPGVSVTTVLTKANFHELPDIVRLARRLGVDSLNIQTSITSWGKTEMEERAAALRLASSSPQLEDALNRAEAQGREIGLTVRIWREDVYTRSRKCPWPWTRVFLAANGDVVPCCILADADVISMGNIFDKGFDEIWNSAQYREFRRRIRTHRLYDFCKGCYGE